MVLGHLLSQALDLRSIYTINAISYDDDKKIQKVKISNIPDLSNFTNILIVDDIVDSGETMYKVLQLIKCKYKNSDIKTLSIFYKDTAIIKPDITIKQTNEWIEFFWEVDLKN